MTYAEIKSSVEDANGCKNGKSAGKIIWINYKKWNSNDDLQRL